MKKALLAVVLLFGSLGYVFVNRAAADQNPSTPITISTSADTSSSATIPTPSAGTAPAGVPAAARPTPATPATRPAPAPASSGMYKDGTYTGSTVDAYYGYVQVAAVISGGKLANVRVLQYPSDRGTSIEINRQALPILISEAISAQSARVDAVSGASETSPAFVESLSSALAKAKA